MLDAAASGAARADPAHVAERQLLRCDRSPSDHRGRTASSPSAWGRCFAPALDRLDGYIVAGLPVIAAIPGLVYGDAGWFRQRVIEPVMAGRRVLQFRKTEPLGVSPFTSTTAPAPWCIWPSTATRAAGISS